MLRKIILYTILIILSFSLASCQAIQGLGEDIKWTSEKCAELLEGGE